MGACGSLYVRSTESWQLRVCKGVRPAGDRHLEHCQRSGRAAIRHNAINLRLHITIDDRLCAALACKSDVQLKPAIDVCFMSKHGYFRVCKPLQAAWRMFLVLLVPEIGLVVTQ